MLYGTKLIFFSGRIPKISWSVLFLSSSLFFAAASGVLFGVDKYTVLFKGDISDEMIELLRCSSQLVALQEHPPLTAIALRRRAEADLPRFAKALQSLAYYDVEVDLRIDLDQTPAAVIFTIRKGAKFLFRCFTINSTCNSSLPINPEVIGIKSGIEAYPALILQAEERLLRFLAMRSYPLALIKERRVKADLTDHSVDVDVELDPGPKVFFGATSILGAKTVASEFFCKKLPWREGMPFDVELLEEAQHAMEASALFSSIAVTHADSVEADNRLPIQIDVIESKQQSVGVGVGYSRLRDFGALFEYEHRNMRHIGERLALRTAIWRATYDGSLFYLVPDWYCRGQDLLWLAESKHDITKGYRESSVTASLIIEKQVSEQLKISYGLMGKKLRNVLSDNDGNFNLLKIPFSIKWSAVDDPLDPVQGYAIHCKIIPTVQIHRNRFAYLISTLSASSYMPIFWSDSSVLAFKFLVGSILGSERRTIPPSERFYAGSEETLRGYGYLTVSPLDHEQHPVGGRSLLICNMECRTRFNDQLSSVLFCDVGNVYSAFLPEVWRRQLVALGCGLRYHTPVGPLRLDIAFPLRVRHGVDRHFEIYLSMGQTF